MQITVLLAHPDNQSFNAAIARAAIAELERNGHDVVFHDLYAEQFDPILPSHEISKDATVSEQVDRHCKELACVDGIVVVHPNWWGQPPAILKGWVDRIIRPGVAYEFLEGDAGEGIPVGLLKAKAALVFNTSNTEAQRELREFGDPLETLWKNCIFGLCGVNTFHREMFGVVVTSTLEQRVAWLARVTEAVGRYFPKQGEGCA